MVVWPVTETPPASGHLKLRREWVPLVAAGLAACAAEMPGVDRARHAVGFRPRRLRREPLRHVPEHRRLQPRHESHLRDLTRVVRTTTGSATGATTPTLARLIDRADRRTIVQ